MTRICTRKSWTTFSQPTQRKLFFYSLSLSPHRQDNNKDKDKREGRREKEKGGGTWMLGPLVLVDNEVGSVHPFILLFC